MREESTPERRRLKSERPFRELRQKQPSFQHGVGKVILLKSERPFRELRLSSASDLIVPSEALKSERPFRELRPCGYSFEHLPIVIALKSERPFRELRLDIKNFDLDAVGRR